MLQLDTVTALSSLQILTWKFRRRDGFKKPATAKDRVLYDTSYRLETVFFHLLQRHKPRKKIWNVSICLFSIVLKEQSLLEIITANQHLIHDNHQAILLRLPSYLVPISFQDLNAPRHLMVAHLIFYIVMELFPNKLYFKKVLAL